jgi:hypothetical protein
MVTPNAGRITTSSVVIEEKSNSPSGPCLRNQMPISRSRAFTCGLWMISPTRKRPLLGKLGAGFVGVLDGASTP